MSEELGTGIGITVIVLLFVAAALHLWNASWLSGLGLASAGMLGLLLLWASRSLDRWQRWD